MPSVGDRPHSNENMPKPVMLNRNTLTAPNRWASQPVNGTQIIQVEVLLVNGHSCTPLR